ncbi:CotH kinase family protein [Candidatus Sumerlaeota bacterium]|nr:CotH kinase family protein [Candidatus Sumerlaeota bacterium]
MLISSAAMSGCRRVIVFFMALLLLTPVFYAGAQGLVINKLMAANDKTAFDDDGDYSDWIELRNTGAAAINLYNYALTDSPGESSPWRFPAITLQPDEYLIVWASDKNRTQTLGAEVFGGGADIWSVQDSFHFEYQQVDGDFDVSMRLHSLSDTDQWAKAGLMARDSLTSDSRNVFVRATADQGQGVQWRTDHGGLTQISSTEIPYVFPYVWLRLVRSGDQITAYHGTGAADWTQIRQITLTGLSQQIYLGVAVCGHDEGTIAYASCSNYQLNSGSLVSPGWTGVDIGTTDIGTSRSAQALHADFKLKSGGETVALYNATGTLLNQVTYPALTDDIAYGRMPTDGSWRFMQQATPGEANTTATAAGVTATPQFSQGGGIYTSTTVKLLMNCATAGSSIYYTLDGCEPTTADTLYASAISITTPTVVRARAFVPDYLPSAVATASYLIDQPKDLPLISIVTDPDNLWGTTGIYDNADMHGEEWERPCSVEYFTTDGLRTFSADCGIRIHGGMSRFLCPKKSLRLYFRSDYGPKKLNYPLFEDSSATKYDKIILRAGFNDCWAYFQEDPIDTQRIDTNYVRDQVVRDIHLDMGRLASHGNFAEIYLNGQYWGLYNPSERIEAKFAGSYYGNDDWDIIKLEGEVTDGDSGAWMDYQNYIDTTDFSDTTNYSALANRLDLANYTDYMILNIWAQNYDWPEHNGYWGAERNKPASQWISILWDSEISFGTGHESGDQLFDYNMLSLIEGSGNPLATLFNKLALNSAYRREFIQRFDYLANTYLSEQNILAHLEQRLSEVAPAIPREAARWGYARDGMPARGYADWLIAAQKSRDFVSSRTLYVRQHMVEQFEDLDGWTQVTIGAPIGAGTVSINGITPSAYPWTGTFFTGSPIALQATPASGYRFSHWSDPSLPMNASVQLTLSGGGASTTLIDTGSQWLYDDSGTDLGEAWRESSYDDSSWSSGTAQLGYGDGDENTTLSFGSNPDDKYPCYYFRRHFTVADALIYAGLKVELLRDDGAVVYLNGSELLRDNMSTTDTIIYTTLASEGVGDEAENQYHTFTLAADALTTGENVLAVEVHQIAPESSDISFDLKLYGVTQDSTGYSVYANFISLSDLTARSAYWHLY